MADQARDYSPGIFLPDHGTDPAMQPSGPPWGGRPPWPTRPPWPSPPWSRPHNYNQDRFVYATLSVLCFGTIALAVICWTCCRKNKGNSVKSTDTPVVIISEMPPPPPYYPPSHEPTPYERPPRYSGIYIRAEDLLNHNENVQEDCPPCTHATGGSNCSPDSRVPNMESVIVK